MLSGTRFIHLPDIDITTSTNVDQVFQRHSHESLCIGFVERGARIITTREAEVRIFPGEIYLLNPEQTHACQSVGTPNRFRIISLRADVVRSLVSYQPRFEPIRLVDGQITHSIRQLCELAGRDHEPLERTAVLVLLLTRLITCYSDPTPTGNHQTLSPAIIRRAQEYIQAYYTYKLSLVELAAVCHLSPYHFQRTFVEHTGLSPHDYQVQVRIRHSKTLLRQGLSIAKVAQEVGFVDQSHFTHSFRRMVGMTPGHFVQQNQS
jgi:AraC-like DNA-binding protein